MSSRILRVVTAAAVTTLSVVAAAVVLPGAPESGGPTAAAQPPAPRPVLVAGPRGTATADAVSTRRADRPRPRLSTTPVLPRRLRGPAAVTALGSRLDAVARRNGLTTPQLRHLLRTDPSAWVSPSGQVAFVDPAPEVAASTTSDATSTGSTAAAAYPTSQTFTLHSRPGADRVLFLDLDGATVSGTQWNDQSDPQYDMSSGAYPGYDSDGNPAAFSSAEHAWAQEVWRQVAETYAPFDVDVTTQDPGAGAYTYSGGSDRTYGTRVVFTSSATAAGQACGVDPGTQSPNCIGVAFLDTFHQAGNAPYDPAWVFTRMGSGPMPATLAAQSASHETGHTLGLSHDAVSASAPTGAKPYYAGTRAWGPIMGSAAYRAVSQWSRGEYAYASNTEDGLARIQSAGLPLRADDHRDDTTSPDVLGAAASYAVDGVVSTRTDRDVFALDRTCTSGLTAAVSGIGPQTALDLSLEVLDPSGTVVARSDPASTWTGTFPVSAGMDASVSLPTAGPGRFFLRVDGVGNGSPTSGGWSDYASLGQYHLTASGCPVTPPSAPPSASPTDPAPGADPTSSPSASPTGDPASAPSAPSSPPAATDPPTTTPPTPGVTTTPVPARAPGPPRIGTAYSGATGGVVTAGARWGAPTSTGGSPVLRYRVAAKRLDARNRTVATYYASSYSPAGARAVDLRLPRGRYVFVVRAWNAVGPSGWSTHSRIVTAR